MTYDKPLSSAYTGDSELHETCVWLGCVAAKGKSTETDVFNAIFEKFQTMSVTTKDGRTLSYWGAGASTGENYNTSDLLRYGDGRCGSWADLFFTTIASQGISIIFKYHLNFIQRECNINNILYTDLCIKQLGDEFQGKKSSTNQFINNYYFVNHSFNKYNNYYYDVSVKNNIIYNNIEDFLANNIEIWGFNNNTNLLEKIEPYNMNLTYSCFFNYQLCNINHLDIVGDEDCCCPVYPCQ